MDKVRRKIRLLGDVKVWNDLILKKGETFEVKAQSPDPNSPLGTIRYIDVGRDDLVGIRPGEAEDIEFSRKELFSSAPRFLMAIRENNPVIHPEYGEVKVYFNCIWCGDSDVPMYIFHIGDFTKHICAQCTLRFLGVTTTHGGK